MTYVLNVKAVVAAFNQEKALVGAFSVITNLRMQLFEAMLEAGGFRPPRLRPRPRVIQERVLVQRAQPRQQVLLQLHGGHNT